MGDLFVSVLNMSISAAWVLLAVLILRLIFKKAPKRITVLLWCIVGLRLIMPFSVESIFSLIPSNETVSKAWDSPRPNLNSGITVIDNGVNNYLEGIILRALQDPPARSQITARFKYSQHCAATNTPFSFAYSLRTFCKDVTFQFVCNVPIALGLGSPSVSASLGAIALCFSLFLIP